MDAERAFRILLLSVIIILTFLLLEPYTEVILAGILLAYLLSTPFDWLAPHIGDRPAAMGLILATGISVLVPLVILLNVVVSGVDQILEAIGAGGARFDFSYAVPLLESIFNTNFDDPTAVIDLLQRGEFVNLLGKIFDAIGSVSEAGIQVAILLFVWYYLLKDGDRFLAWLGDVTPLSEQMRHDLFERADELMYVVVIGNFLVAVADGLLVTLGLWAVGFSDVLFWAFIAIFLALIPLVGTMLLWIPASIYLVAVGDVLGGVGLFLYGAVIVGAVDNVLRPFLGAPDVGLEPGLFVIGVLVGLGFFGVTGIFYGPVLLVMAKVVVETVSPALQNNS